MSKSNGSTLVPQEESGELFTNELQHRLLKMAMDGMADHDRLRALAKNDGDGAAWAKSHQLLVAASRIRAEVQKTLAMLGLTQFRIQRTQLKKLRETKPKLLPLPKA